ncbi:hypothetical protein O181_053701 [Austropuccinia psidii MF-1]|uniref:Retroviral polymerase SH3-like domain-containing protein n=1 Tax=Austropuccinia psidii MF-1 TaxID=1389203 RepID=A0A9Q3HQF4_9BASI|nr:hypothetical protein [Austropuccinia psidii MF-1]
MLLRHKKLYHHCVDATLPIIEDDSRPSAAENRVFNANAETCNLIAGTLYSATFTEIFDDDETMENSNLLWSKCTKCFASSTFNNQAHIWMRFCRITCNGNLLSSISEIRQCLNEVISIKVEVTTNTETLGNPNAILNLLHDVALKEEALHNQNNTQKLALNREVFRSKTIHYCKDGRHNPLASHPAEGRWKLHTELRPEKYKKEVRVDLTIAQELITKTHTHDIKYDKLTVVLDTGASNHMFNEKHFFTNMPISTGCDKFTLSATETGTVKLLDKDGAMWTLKGFLILETKIAIPKEERCLNKVKLNWHDRLGHLHNQGIKKLLPEFEEEDNCGICTVCNFPQIPFQHSFQKTTSLLENIHIDLCGPIQTPSLSGVKYFMILVDQFLGYISIKFLKQKGKAFTHFRNFKVYTEKKLNRKILNITSNGGVIENTRCLLLQSKLPTQYWAEAAATATMLCNLTRKGSKTPYELWHKIYPPIDKLKAFGCKAWVRIPDSERAGRFDAVEWEGIMLGYANQASAYLIVRMTEKSVVISRHVKFDESSFLSLAVDTPSVPMEIPYFIFAGENKEISLEADTGDLTPNSTPEEDVFHDALEELPVRRIKVIGPWHPTLITSNISTDNILPFSQSAHTTMKYELEEVPRNYID